MKKLKLLLFPLLTMCLTACSLKNIYDIVFNNGSSSPYIDPDYSSPELSTLENTESKKNLTYNIKDYDNHSVYNTPMLSNTGNPNILVVPVWFRDSANHVKTSEKSKIRSDIQRAYFGSNSDTGWRSVKSYYLEASYGQLSIGGSVTDWWECGMYGTSMNESTVDLLVQNAATWYKSKNNDISQYDYDKDGYIDCICLIYAYPNSYNDNDTLWAYCYWLQDQSLKNTSNPGPNTYFWASYDFMYSGGGGDNSRSKIDAHTYIHEMGHVLGLDDYYDYATSKTYINSPAGGFSMQDYNVGDHDPYSKLVLGWVKPYVPTGSCTINIHDFERSGDVVVLSPQWIGSPFDEYLILELYTPRGLNTFDSTSRYGGEKSGYPKGPSVAGIRIWHVDSRLMYVTNGDEVYSSSRISNTITSGKYYSIANTNTTYTSSTKDYAAELESFRSFNLLQLLRNNTTSSYGKGSGHTLDLLKQTDLWLSNTTFTMTKYSKQFVNSGKFNNGKSLNVSVNFKNVSNDSATIEITM